MSNKITALSFWLIAVLFISLCRFVLQAQEPAAPATTAKPVHSEIRVTGCLQKGDAADEFAIAGMARPGNCVATPSSWPSTSATQ